MPRADDSDCCHDATFSHFRFVLALQSGTATLLRSKADVSADSRDPQLLTDLAGKSIVNLAMPRYRSLSAVRRIRKNSVTPTFPRDNASVSPQMIQQFAPFHLEAAPA
jgi:hypothetical protein